MAIDVINPQREGKRELFLRGSGNAGDRATFQITNAGIKVLNTGYLLIGTKGYRFNATQPLLDVVDGTSTGLNLLIIPQGQTNFNEVLSTGTEIAASGMYRTSTPGFQSATGYSISSTFSFDGTRSYTANGLGRGQAAGYMFSPSTNSGAYYRWTPGSDGKITADEQSRNSTYDSSTYVGVFGTSTGTWANTANGSNWQYGTNVGNGQIQSSNNMYTTFTANSITDGIPEQMNSNSYAWIVGNEGALFYSGMNNTNRQLFHFWNSSVFGTNATLGAIGYGRIANSPAPNASIYLIAENSPTRRFWYATNPSGTWQQYSGAVHPNNNGYLSKIRFIGTRAFVFDSNFGTVYSSNDLTTWTAVASTVSSGSRYFGFIGSFLVLLSEGNSESTSAPFMQYSTDGVTWTPVYNLSSGAPGQAYHYSLIYEPTSQYWWSFMGDTYRHAFASGTGTTTASIHIPTRFKIGTPAAIIELYENTI